MERCFPYLIEAPRSLALGDVASWRETSKPFLELPASQHQDLEESMVTAMHRKIFVWDSKKEWGLVLSWRLLPVVNIRIRGGSIIFYIVVPIQEINTERTTDNGSPSGTPQVLLEGRLMQLLKKSTRFILCRKSTHCTANVRGIPNFSIIAGIAILGIVLKNFVRSVTTPVRVIGFW